MQSPGDRANILDPRLNEIGVGLVRQGGYLWAVEDFSASVAVLGSSQIEGTISQLLSQRGIEPASGVAAARETCAMDHGAAEVCGRNLLCAGKPPIYTGCLTCWSRGSVPGATAPPSSAPAISVTRDRDLPHTILLYCSSR